MILTLDDSPFAGRTGKGVRVAVVDSGIAAGHPHVGVVVEAVVVGVAGDPVTGDLTNDKLPDTADRIGHGTAVAAAIREKAPDAVLISVKVFHRSLVTTADALVRGIERSVALGARVINLSLGTANATHEGVLAAAVAAAGLRGAVVVSARESAGVRWLPGALDGVVGVVADWGCARDAVAVDERAEEALHLTTSPYPRPIPGVPQERNLSGVSFAVANATGFVARMCEGRADVASVADLRRLLRPVSR